MFNCKRKFRETIIMSYVLDFILVRSRIESIEFLDRQTSSEAYSKRLKMC